MPSKEITAQRFNRAGKTVEQVTVSVTIVGNTVYLYCAGPRRGYHYAMTLDNWNTLKEASPYQ